MGRDAIVQLGGFNVLVGGDPDYQTIVIGNPNPENELLDPAADIPVSQLILQTFNIPFNLSNVLGGNLPGLDIYNQDPVTMLKLSLATELLDTPRGSSGFAEVELDPFGIARFYVSGQVLRLSETSYNPFGFMTGWMPIMRFVSLALLMAWRITKLDYENYAELNLSPQALWRAGRRRLHHRPWR